MTGIFANDTYNNGVTRDDFEQYAHTFNTNARYDNFPLIEDEEEENKRFLQSTRAVRRSKEGIKEDILSIIGFTIAVTVLIGFFLIPHA